MQQFTYSEKGLALTRSFEGLQLTSYKDCAGVWTIGYGHTAPDLCGAMTITEAEADSLLHADLAESVMCVNQGVKVSISQNQFDAMVDFCFNAGRGNFQRSTLLRKLNGEDFAGAAAQFGLWVHAGGEVIDGLVRRRKAEAELFASGAKQSLLAA